MSAGAPGAQESATGPRDPNRTVGELMRTDFRSCNIDTNAREVAQALQDSQCPILAVTRAQVPIGVVTERALASAIAEYGPALEDRTAGDLKRWDSPTYSHPEPVPLVSQADLVNPILRVADAMTAAPRTCSPVSSVLEAVMIFRDEKCGAVPVVDDGRAVGMLTDRDVALALGEHEAELSRLPVESVMTADFVTIKSDATLESAIECIGEQGIRRLLVVDSDERLVGILSWTDLVSHLSERGVGHTVALMIGHP